MFPFEEDVATVAAAERFTDPLVVHDASEEDVSIDLRHATQSSFLPDPQPVGCVRSEIRLRYHFAAEPFTLEREGGYITESAQERSSLIARIEEMIGNSETADHRIFEVYGRLLSGGEVRRDEMRLPSFIANPQAVNRT